MKRTAIVTAASLGLLALSLWLVRGGADPGIQAREAYQRGDYGAAVREYQKAAPVCSDLAALAANQGAAFYRLDRYGDADKRYELAESAGPNSRIPRTAYDRGNCALREACGGATCPEPTKLEQAAQHFRACLARETETADTGDLFSDARHNLELTKLLRAPTPAEEPTNSAGQQDTRSGDRQLPGSEETNARDSSKIGRSDTRSSADAPADNPRPTSTFANFLARREDNDYLCPDCRRELEQAGLTPARREDRSNGIQAKDANQDSNGEGTTTRPPASGERPEDQSAGTENQVGRQSQDAKQVNASKEQQKSKESPRDEQAAAAEGERGEWRDLPKQQQGKGPT